MLAAIASTTLGDDDFQQDSTTLDLEAWVADLTGKEAGLLVLSGTMGNQVSVRTHLEGPPHSLICDRRAHIYTHEAGGIASLCGVLVNPIEPANGKYLTLQDIQAKAVTTFAHVTDCTTRVICLENTIAGVVMPLAECQRIARWARLNNLIMHLDGARLWEAVAAGAGSLRDYCACFDSVSLCFSKGLGAPIGSLIVGSHRFRQRARWIRKSIGGGLRQSGVVAAPMRVGLEETFFGGKLEVAHRQAQKIASIWERYGGKLSYPVETNMVWLDIAAAGIKEADIVEMGELFGLKLMGARIVVHYQIADEAIGRLERLMQVLMGARAKTA